MTLYLAQFTFNYGLKYKHQQTLDFPIVCHSHITKLIDHYSAHRIHATLASTVQHCPTPAITVLYCPTHYHCPTLSWHSLSLSHAVPTLPICPTLSNTHYHCLALSHILHHIISKSALYLYRYTKTYKPKTELWTSKFLLKVTPKYIALKNYKTTK